MDFLGMGMAEILLILIVAIIVWGPGRIVEIGRTLGKAIRTFKKTTSELTATVTREIDLEEKKHSPPPKIDTNDRTQKSPDTDTTESHNEETDSPSR